MNFATLGTQLLSVLMIGVSASARAAAEVRGNPWGPAVESSHSQSCQMTLGAMRGQLDTLGTTAMLALLNGQPLFEYGPTSKVSYIASARKSMLALLYGQYVEKGVIPLNSTLSKLSIDEDDGLLPSEREAMVRDLISARSGIFHQAANAGDDTAFAPARGSQPPGTYFLYNNWDFNAAGAAFERLTGEDIYVAFKRDIADPIGMQDFRIDQQKRYVDRKRSRYGAYHFYLSTRDMARLGQLMLNEGRWGEREVVPTSWIRQITATSTAAADMHPEKTARVGLGFGYMWWLFEDPPTSPLHGAYLAWGYLGQYILVVPQRQMVIAHKVEPRWFFQRDVPLSKFMAIARLLIESDC